MAYFNVVSLFTTNVDSDWLFPGSLGASFDIVEAASDHFSIKYTSGPAAGLTVKFISDGSTLTYNGNAPSSGSFNEIHLVGGGLLPNTIAKWTGLASTQLTSFGEPTLAETLLGNTDNLLGDGGKDVLRGYEGPNLYIGKGGNDTFVLDAGNSDSVIHGSDSDGSGGGTEIDTIKLLAANSLRFNDITNIDRVVFAGNTDTTLSLRGANLGGISATLEVTGDGHDNQISILASSSSTALSVNLSGFSFKDWTLGQDKVLIDGSTDIDSLTGSNVSDEIVAGGNNDYVRGGRGQDFISGGDGDDVFDFNKAVESKRGAVNRDVIADFEHGSDHIDLADLDGKSRHGLQHFKFIGTQHFHHKQGELHYTAVDADTVILSGDRSGDGKADFQVEVNGVGSLTIDDFFFTPQT